MTKIQPCVIVCYWLKLSIFLLACSFVYKEEQEYNTNKNNVFFKGALTLNGSKKNQYQPNPEILSHTGNVSNDGRNENMDI